MADDDKELTAAEEANFGGQPKGEEPSGYIANFNGDEIDGVTYQMGDRIADNVDQGTIAYLVQNGRITPTTPGAAGSPSGAEGATGIPQPEKANAPTLTAEQQADADKLKDDNTRDQLLAIAKDEDVAVETDDNKADLAAKIVAKRAK